MPNPNTIIASLQLQLNQLQAELEKAPEARAIRPRAITKMAKNLNIGEVVDKSKLLKPGRTSSGHLTVAAGKGNSRYVHQLVLEAFVGPTPEGMEGLHRDDDKENNTLLNLRYGTRSENLKDAYRNGRR